MSTTTNINAKQEKLSLIPLIDDISDIDLLKSMLKTFILTKSDYSFDSQLHDMLLLNSTKLLTEKKENILSLSLSLQCLSNSLESFMADVIAEYLQKLSPLKLGYKSYDDCHIIKRSQFENDSIIIPPIFDETYITLSQPQLLGDIHCPFQVSFDLTFPYHPNEGRKSCNRHGGIYFGFKDNKQDRLSGNYTINQGAECTVIDWNDRFDENKPDHGFRIHGTHKNILMFDRYKTRQNPPKKWKIIFKKNNECGFYANGEKVHSFNCVSNEGLIGFWMYKNCGLCIENLQVTKI